MQYARIVPNFCLYGGRRHPERDRRSTQKHTNPRPSCLQIFFAGMIHFHAWRVKIMYFDHVRSPCCGGVPIFVEIISHRFILPHVSGDSEGRLHEWRRPFCVSRIVLFRHDPVFFCPLRILYIIIYRPLYLFCINWSQ